MNSDIDMGGPGSDICYSDPDVKYDCEFSYGIVTSWPDLSQYFAGQSARLTFSPARELASASVDTFMVREPDGDRCVAPRVAGVVVTGGQSVTTSYPADDQLTPDDDPASGDNRCSTQLEGAYGIEVTSRTDFGHLLELESTSERFDVVPARR